MPIQFVSIFMRVALTQFTLVLSLKSTVATAGRSQSTQTLVGCPEISRKKIYIFTNYCTISAIKNSWRIVCVDEQELAHIKLAPFERVEDFKEKGKRGCQVESGA